jgi:hypothetical protein
MSERLIIDVVSAEDVWSNSYGEYQAYMLDVKTEDGRIVGNVSSNRKLKDDGSHFEPKEGEEVWGSLESKGGGKWKLTLDSQRMKAEPLGGSRPASRPSESSTGTKSSKGETDWEVRNAEIRRQHSQEMAVRVLAIVGLPTKGTTDIVRDIAVLADEFDQDAIAAGQKASQGAGAGTGGGGSPTSSSVHSTSAPPPEQSSAKDTHWWLSNLLEQGGASSYAADKLASFAIEELSPENLKKCEGLLSNLDSQVDGRKRLETSYTKAKGESVPQIDPAEDDIPF